MGKSVFRGWGWTKKKSAFQEKLPYATLTDYTKIRLQVWKLTEFFTSLTCHFEVFVNLSNLWCSYDLTFFLSFFCCCCKVFAFIRNKNEHPNAKAIIFRIKISELKSFTSSMRKKGKKKKMLNCGMIVLVFQNSEWETKPNSGIWKTCKGLPFAHIELTFPISNLQ